ncbi:MAG: sialidase family protein [Planctomycetota bacterium]|jgi:hypothetical protein
MNEREKVECPLFYFLIMTLLIYALFASFLGAQPKDEKIDADFLNRQQVTPLAAAPRITDVEHTVIHYDKKLYCGHTRISLFKYLGKGEMVIGYNRAPCKYQVYEDVRHINYGSRSVQLLRRSFDGGRTWPAEEIIQLFDQTWPVEKKRSIVFPKKATREKYDMFKPESVFCNIHTTLSEDIFGRRVCFMLRSQDKGRTWETVPTVLKHPFDEEIVLGRHGTGVIRMPDGKTLMSAFYTKKPVKKNVFEVGPEIYISTDHGITWQFLSYPMVNRSGRGNIIYPTLLRLPNGRLHCYALHLDSKDEEVEGLKNALCLSISQDEGKSWSEPVPIAGKGRGCWKKPQGKGSIYRSPWPILLRDDRILLVFARRRLPAGLGGIVSSDGGRTWSEEFVIRDDAQWWDLGYPVGCQLEDGRIFLAYYYNMQDGNKQGGTRFVAGSSFRIAD